MMPAFNKMCGMAAAVIGKGDTKETTPFHDNTLPGSYERSPKLSTKSSPHIRTTGSTTVESAGAPSREIHRQSSTNSQIRTPGVSYASAAAAAPKVDSYRSSTAPHSSAVTVSAKEATRHTATAISTNHTADTAIAVSSRQPSTPASPAVISSTSSTPARPSPDPTHALRQQIATLTSKWEWAQNDRLCTQQRLQEKDRMIQERDSAIRERDNALADLRRRIEGLQNESASKEQHLNDAKDLLQLRTTELSSVQAFLVTTDQCSGADIVRLVEAVNSEIYQTAAMLVDSMESWPKLDKSVMNEDNELYRREMDRLASLLGEDVVVLLHQSHEHEELEGIVQSVVQFCLVQSVGEVQRNWVYGDADFSRNLRRLRERIEEQELPSVSRRWRAMTAKAAKRGAQGTDSDIVMRNLRPYIDGIVLLAGFSSIVASDDSFAQSMASRVAEIAKTANELSNSMNCRMASMDLHLLVPQSGNTFQEQWMVDSNAPKGWKGPGKGQGGSRKRDRQQSKVLLTTEVGLYSECAPDDSKSRERNSKVLLEAKVMLHGAWDA